MNRRNFIKLSALTGTSATLASCGNPEYHLIRFAPEDRLTAGIAVWSPSICPLCPAGCGLTVRVMEGDTEIFRDGKLGVMKMGLAKKLEGDPKNPINQGKLCTRGQAAAQITYHPDRIGTPLKRVGARGEGKYEEISWERALTEFAGKLDGAAAANDPKALAILTGRRNGKRVELLREFASRFGASPPAVFEFFSDDTLRYANSLSFGKAQLPTLDLGESRYLISFGADFLGTWNSPVAQNVAYGQMRQGRPGVRGKFVQVEYRMSQTGANADEWVPAKPGTEGVLAAGLAHVIMKSGVKTSAGIRIDLTEFTPQEVEKRTGVAAARVERLAKEFMDQQPGVAIAAGAALAQTNGLFTALAVNALNALVGSVGEPGGIFFMPEGNSGTDSNFVKNNEIGVSPLAQVLLIDGANPVFASPKAWGVKEALMKVPCIVSFGNFIDETSALADLILPDHSFLESWVQASPESGAKVPVSAFAPPVMLPLHNTRSMPDVLIEVGKKLAKPVNLPWPTFEAMLKPSSVGAVREAQARQRAASSNDRPGRSQTAPTGGGKYTEPQFDGDPSQFPFHFLPYASTAFLDGSLAHLPILQELPDPISSAMWSNWVEINMQTAEKLGIHQGDLVEITSTQGSIRAPAFPSPGIAPDVVAMPVGQGHENYTRYATGRGENPISILAPVQEEATGSLAWAATRVRIAKVADADGRLVMFGGSLREYPGEKGHR